MIVTQIKSKPNFLKLVDTKSISVPISHETFARAGWQRTLFANDNPSLIMFIRFTDITESEFTAVLQAANPKFLFDLRRVPRFDLGRLTRRQAFALFSKAGIQYFDLSGNLNSPEFADRDPGHVAQFIAHSSHQTFVRGPLALLVDAQQFEEAYITRLIEALPAVAAMTWDVLRVPIVSTIDKQSLDNRNVLFISHANPDDNAFTMWLAGQLTLAGYSIWSDITQLVGGETFWDDIEKTIRFRAVKVIAVLSKAAQSKPGVLDEIDLAVRVERALSLRRFVLPVRLDSLPYSDVRANIARKNIIDFSENWASGLRLLLNVLERDSVPTKSSENVDVLARWVRDRLGQESQVISAPENLTSNWLPIAAMPSAVFLYDVSAPVERLNEITASLQFPAFRYLRLVGSFASPADVQSKASCQVLMTEAYRISLGDFLRGMPRALPGLGRAEANKLIANLLRQAWNSTMIQLGLRAYETASGQLAWYMPSGFLDKARIEFVDGYGKKRRKSLVGWSERRKVHWHFAVEARPVLSTIPRFVLRQHVIFTSDGSTPLESKEKMHLLRRRFCKNWWNNQWRDLLIAFVTWLSRASQGQLLVGTIGALRISENLMSITSPVSLGQIDDRSAFGYDDDGQLDSLDDDDDEDDVPDEAELISSVNRGGPVE